jgi:hypothetical protein
MQLDTAPDRGTSRLAARLAKAARAEMLVHHASTAAAAGLGRPALPGTVKLQLPQLANVVFRINERECRRPYVPQPSKTIRETDYGFGFALSLGMNAASLLR